MDLLDDSSVDAVEQVIGTDEGADDLEPNPVETSPNPVSPSASSMSLTDAPHPSTVVANHQHNYSISNMTVPVNRNDMVSSPKPTPTSEDFSIHNKIGTSGNAGAPGEVSPTSVACMMDIKDFEQKTSSYVDPLDWLMDVGVYQLPASDGEEADDDGDSDVDYQQQQEQHKANISANRLAQVNNSALSVLDDFF